MGGGSGILWLLFLILPTIAGIFIGIVKPPEAVAWINDASAWWERHYSSVKARGGFIIGGLWRALIWGFHTLHRATEPVADEAVRAGMRVALFFFIGGVSLFVIASLIYLAVVLAMILIGFWILGKFLGWETSNGDPGRDYPAPRASRKGTSRRRQDWLGDEYVEHLDENGRPVGRSDVRKDWLGDAYVERRNAEGEVVETSRGREDWLGDEYTEHRGVDGERTGESRDRKDWLGDDYVEHRDADNEVAGRSTRRRDWLGDPYTEHEPSD